MDTGALALLIPILALSIPVLAIVFSGLVKVAQARHGIGGDVDGTLSARVDALEMELDGVRQELAETHERLDFAERMLSRGSETAARVIRMPGRPDPDADPDPAA